MSSRQIDRFHCRAIKNISKTVQWIKSRNCVLIGSKYTSLSFRSVPFPKPQIFVEMFRRNLRSSVWSRHVGTHLLCTNGWFAVSRNQKIKIITIQ